MKPEPPTHDARLGGSPGFVTDEASAPCIPDYELLRRIGQGGYGEVWLARGLTGVLRAVKIVWRERFADAAPYEREFRGVKEAMAFSHEPGQLALHHVGQDGRGGFFYYVMELADDATGGRSHEPGQYVPLTLKELKARRGRLPAAACVTLGVEVARALATMHGHGLVHRDIKPSNIVLVNGQPKLADLGLVSASTEARTLVGTQGYLPPEGPGAAAADVYALGKVLYELATGLDRDEFPRLPERTGAAAESRVFFGLNQIILRACEPRAERRYRDAGALLADLRALAQGRAPRSARVRRLTLAAAALGLALALGWAIPHGWPRATPPPAKGSPPAAVELAKSIAVLPLENLSPDPNDAYFAAGVHEDLLTALTDLKGLRVISRTSVMQYRGTTKTAAQIARELGATYVLTGSVRRAGNRVRVTGQLVKAATDQPLWGNSYDRDLQDIFAVQSDLAQQIAGALDATLSPADIAGLAAQPTRSVAAYECLQKARSLSRGMVDERDIRERVVPLLERAVALDPKYVEAWVELARQRLILAGTSDQKDQGLAPAREALGHAELLAPDSYIVLDTRESIAAATGDRATVDALRRKIIELFPQRAESRLWMALSAQREGHWEEARQDFLAALQLDPRNVDVLENFYFYLDAMRRWDEAGQVAARLAEIQPDNLDLRLTAASMAFRRTGSTAPLTRLLTELPHEDPSGTDTIAVRVRIAFLTGDWLGIVSLWREAGARFRTGGYSEVTAKLMVAGAYLRLGDPASARPLLDQCRDATEQRLGVVPADTGLLVQLGTIRGMMGDRVGARTTLDRARDLMAARPAKSLRFSERWDYAIARCWVDDKSAVIRTIQPLLREPASRAPTHNVHLLRVSWVTIPLQGDPEFEAMLNDPKNNAPLF